MCKRLQLHESVAHDSVILLVYIREKLKEIQWSSSLGLWTFPKADRKRLANVQVELDQCWDLLRQRRALRDVGLDPDEAEVRPPQVVENYEQ